MRDAGLTWAVAVVTLMLMALAMPSKADLGCFNGGPPGLPDFATCSVAADCAPVGGVDCTSGFCFCTAGSLAPGCPCAAAAAPAVSHQGLIGLAGLLSAVGLFRLWRRAARDAHHPA